MLGLKCLLLIGALVTTVGHSNALLLGNLMGCNSLACRLAALEADVSNLKRSVSKLEINLGANMQTMNQFRPMNQFNQLPTSGPNPSNGLQGFNQQGFNQAQQGGSLPNGGQQLPNNSNEPPRPVNFANSLPTRDFGSDINYQSQLQRRPQNVPFQPSISALRV